MTNKPFVDESDQLTLFPKDVPNKPQELPVATSCGVIGVSTLLGNLETATGLPVLDGWAKPVIRQRKGLASQGVNK